MVSYREYFDTKEKALAWIEQELKWYHPCGYGTYLDEPKEEPDGRWFVSGSRGSSAD